MAVAAVVGGAVVGGVAQDRAASKAAKAQKRSAQAGLDLEERQFYEAIERMEPFAQPGGQAIQEQAAMLGLSGPEAQAAALQSVEQSPLLDMLVQSGERGMLQNASATGGLRGGNLQKQLMEYRPELTQELINNRFNQLSQLTSFGQAAAAGQAAAGQNYAQRGSALLGQQGAASAGRHLAQGEAIAGVANLGMMFGGRKMGMDPNAMRIF